MISFNNLGNLGRLANQMFQYASLKGIARNRGYEFSIPPKTVFGTRDPMVNKDVMNRFNELKELIGNADPKAVAKLPDSIKTVFGL